MWNTNCLSEWIRWMKWLSLKERYYFKVNEVKSWSVQTVFILSIFSPLPNKLPSTLHAAYTVSIIPILCLESGMNFGQGHLFPVKKTHDYFLLRVDGELNMLDVWAFWKLCPFSLSIKEITFDLIWRIVR
jgi:hypothetical protein